jgi:glycosyltransferase involved in cell wall biosynthesis
MGDAVIAICMAAYEPDEELFAAQVESIRAQTLGSWTCTISDDGSQPQTLARMAAAIGGDERFRLERSGSRLGFYRNFERALATVPEGAALVALADQDDRWAPRKLEVLSRAIGSARLAYGDARLVDREGRVLSPTFWAKRRPNRGDLASLLFANSVTGAAALFRRELLDLALPFPTLPGHPFHDHWLALVALASGEIAYVDEALYDYVQHEGAVLGHGGSLPPVGDAEALPAGSRSERWRRAYFDDYRRVLGLARALQERCAPLPDARRRRALGRVLRSESSPLAPAWLAARLARSAFGPSDTGGAERTLLAALAWRWLARSRGYSPDEEGSQR